MKLWSVLLSSLIFSGCFQTENSNSADDEFFKGSPEFVAAKIVFRRNCTTSCHQHAYEQQTEAELIAEGLLLPGDAEGSKIYYRIKGSEGSGGSKNMPSDKSIDPSEVVVVKDWINSLNP